MNTKSFVRTDAIFYTVSKLFRESVSLLRPNNTTTKINKQTIKRSEHPPRKKNNKNTQKMQKTNFRNWRIGEFIRATLRPAAGFTTTYTPALQYVRFTRCTKRINGFNTFAASSSVVWG